MSEYPKVPPTYDQSADRAHTPQPQPHMPQQQNFGGQPTYPPPPQVQQTVFVSGPAIVGETDNCDKHKHYLGEHSCAMQCPSCRAQISTQTEYISGLLTWLLVGLLILIGLFVVFCCLFNGKQFSDVGLAAVSFLCASRDARMSYIVVPIVTRILERISECDFVCNKIRKEFRTEIFISSIRLLRLLLLII